MLTESERQTIEATIARAEKTTAAELVVHVVERSDNYSTPRLAWAIFGGAGIVEAVLSLPAATSFAAWGLELSAIAATVLWLAFGRPPILRQLISERAKRVAVHRRAQVAFIENRVHRTRDGTGVLILISQLERRVEILADEGIHARMGIEAWTKHVSWIVEGIAAGRPADGIVRTLEEIARELAEDVPPSPENPNELDNRVILTPQ